MGAKGSLSVIRFAGLLGAALALALLFLQPSLIEVARNLVFDQFQRLSPREQTQTPVRIVEIDDAALAKYGQWPWPRHRLATVIDHLNEAGAAAIVFDIILAEEDRTSPSNIAQSWLSSPTLAPIVSELNNTDAMEVDHDTILAASMKAAPTVLHLTANSIASDRTCKPALPASRTQGMPAQELAGAAASFGEIIPALDQFREAADGEGFARAGLSDDTVVRSAPLIALACNGREVYPSLAIEALRVAAPRLDPQFAPRKFIKAASERPCRTHITGIANQSVSEVVLCKLRIPTTEDGQIWINYSRPDSVAKRSLSVTKVLGNLEQPLSDAERAELAQAVGGRIVMLGASAEGLRDVLITPLGDDRPGVHIHADIIEQVLSGQTLYRAWDLMRPVEIAGAVIVTILLLIFLPKLPATTGFSIWAVLTVLASGAAYFMFAAQQTLLDPITPGIVITSAFVGAFVVMFQHEQIARKFVRGAFGKFLSPLILERLERDPSLLKLEGEEREITAFFSDVRGFTSISEPLEPEQVTTFLNQYFTPMTRIVVEHRGLVDKYMGDGMAAMWNAPIDVDDHPQKACRAALEMVKALKGLNEKWEADKSLPLPEIKIGIGLHTEKAFVGNFGSEDRLEYSMLGDMVNLTSRLESATKQFGVPIIISEDTWARVHDFASVALGTIKVKGREEKVVVFALVGDEEVAATDEFQSFKASFEAGVVAITDGDETTALYHFGACREGPMFGIEEAVEKFSESRAEVRAALTHAKENPEKTPS